MLVRQRTKMEKMPLSATSCLSFDPLAKRISNNTASFSKRPIRSKKSAMPAKPQRTFSMHYANAQAGITTLELDELSRKLHKERHAIPAPLNYGEPPFPKTICTSLNEVICHGIPDERPLVEGDILNIDVSCIVDRLFRRLQPNGGHRRDLEEKSA